MGKKTTSRDVARAAGVSQSLVSLILNNVPGKQIKPETRELVIETAKKLNYKVNISARNMKNQRAGAIGLLSTYGSESFVFPPVINGIKAVCDDNDMGMVVCTGKKDPYGNEDYINYYLQNRIEGLIYVSYVGITCEGVIAKLMENRIPFVCIIGARDIPGVSCVDVSFLESGYIAALHLAERGCRNVAYSLPDGMNYAEKERLEGCMKAAAEQNLDIVGTTALSLSCAGKEKDLLKAAREFLVANKIDGFISTSYQCFIILKAAVQIGIKVPEQLKVISLDNEIYAPYVYPALTTVDEPLYDMAKKAGAILMDRIAGGDFCEKLELPPRLSVRESTAAGREY